jgi:hypothetical protein
MRAVKGFGISCVLRAGTRARTAVVITGALGCALAIADVASATTFTYTGAEQSYVVPDGVHAVHIKAVGGEGAMSPGTATGPFTPEPGGFGSVAAANFPVHPGETLYVEVGGNATGTAGGFNGGGNGDSSGVQGGGGGGASDVRLSSRAAPLSLFSRMIVAAGGGGGGILYGQGGPTAGYSGYNGDSGGPAGGFGGGAGTAFAGGAGGVATCPEPGPGGPGEGSPGSMGTFGAGGVGGSFSGGGGGGGYYGGGGGGGGGVNQYYPVDACSGGGGGGSSYFGTGALHMVLDTGTTGIPEVVISPDRHRRR